MRPWCQHFSSGRSYRPYCAQTISPDCHRATWRGTVGLTFVIFLLVLMSSPAPNSHLLYGEFSLKSFMAASSIARQLSLASGSFMVILRKRR